MIAPENPLTSEFGPTAATPKTGSEPFHNDGKSMGFDLLGFWRWSVSDLVSNATRGRLAEYIVAKALSINTDGIRSEWDAFDLITPRGVKVEVKSAAYIQSWNQKKASLIFFRVPRTRFWDAEINVQNKETNRHADVYVFALLAHTDKKTVDPMDMSQWRFFVLPTCVLDSRTRSQHSISLGSLEKLTSPLQFYGVQAAVQRAAEENEAAQPSLAELS